MSNFEFFLPESSMMQYKSLYKFIKLLSYENMNNINNKNSNSDYDIEEYFLDNTITKNSKKDNDMLFNLRNLGISDYNQNKNINYIFINLCENSKGFLHFFREFNLLVGKIIYIYICKYEKIEPLILTKIYSRKQFYNLFDYIESKGTSFHTRKMEHIIKYIKKNNISKYKIFY
jgi:hypothetical protein